MQSGALGHLVVWLNPIRGEFGELLQLNFDVVFRGTLQRHPPATDRWSGKKWFQVVGIQAAKALQWKPQKLHTVRSCGVWLSEVRELFRATTCLSLSLLQSFTFACVRLCLCRHSRHILAMRSESSSSVQSFKFIAVPWLWWRWCWRISALPLYSRYANSPIECTNMVTDHLSLWLLLKYLLHDNHPHGSSIKLKSHLFFSLLNGRLHPTSCWLVYTFQLIRANRKSSASF